MEMTVDELRYELRQRGGSISGRNKSQLQAALTQAISQPATAMSAVTSQPDETMKPIAQGEEPLQPVDRSVPPDGVSMQPTAQLVSPTTQDRGLELSARPKIPAEVCRSSGVTHRSRMSAADMTTKLVENQLELRRLQLEERRLELQAEERSQQ